MFLAFPLFPRRIQKCLFLFKHLAQNCFCAPLLNIIFLFFTWRNKLTLITYVHDAVVVVAVVSAVVVVVDLFDNQIFKDNLSPPETWTNYSNSMANFPMGVPPTEDVLKNTFSIKAMCASIGKLPVKIFYWVLQGFYAHRNNSCVSAY